MGNAMLDRMWQAKVEGVHLGASMMQQKIFDCLAIVLSDSDVMGKDTFSDKRILKVIYAVRDVAIENVAAWGDITDETDYCREKIDRRLLQIYGPEDFVSFEERYPMLKKIHYGKKG